ncbi:hypothetical protein [Arcanobacterium phocae]|uniref:hypothetical protein n=1 Tax=Arcanobacterium phocae TaxID=131112 RepID=UPI001C0EF2CA|nr:hypothetical protein [Arcanobacterium phocae]
MSVLLCLPSELDSAVLAQLSETRQTHLIARRCADLVEVVAGARARVAQMAIISEDLDGLDMTAIAELRQYVAVAIVAGSSPTCDSAVRRYLSDVDILSPLPHEIANHIRKSKGLGAPSVINDDVFTSRAQTAKGALTVFWGPVGSNGRSTLVRDCSVFLSERRRVLACDGDSFSPSLAQLFDVDESSGLIGVARMIDQGRKVDIEGMLSSLSPSFGNVSLLAGMNTGQRWREISRFVADRLWPALCAEYDAVVVDSSGGLDDKAERLDRWGLTRSLVDQADIRLHVAVATPIGLRRLIEHWDALAEDRVEHEAVVLTSLRSTALGLRPLFQAQNVLREVGIGDIPIFGIRDDRNKLDKVLIQGSSMPVSFPKSGYSRDVARVCSWIEDRMQVCASTFQ